MQRTVYVVNRMAAAEASPRAPLDRAAIVRAGIELADSEGVAALTMRRLAEHLGFKAMALYNHVDGKDEVLALMVDAVAAEVGDPPIGITALDAIRRHAVESRGALVRHPWAPGLWLSSMPGPARTADMELVLRLFAESGMPPDLAHQGFHAVTNHVLGYTLQEQALAIGLAGQDPEAAVATFLDATPVERFPHAVAHVHEHLNGETGSSFELVLDLILDGLSRLSAEQSNRP